MGNRLTGVPKVVARVEDRSLVFNRDTNSIICLMGPTSRGVIGEPVFIRNRNEFIRELGGRLENNEFVLYCLRILDAGGKLWVSRLGHYSDASDVTTLDGSKASLRLGDTGSAETRASVSIDFTGLAVSGNILTINHDGVNVAAYQVQATDTESEVISAMSVIINSSNLGYDVDSIDLVNNVLVMSAPQGLGDTINTSPVNVVSDDGTGNLSALPLSFSGGVTGTENAIYFDAEEIGSGYDGTFIEVLEAASGQTDKIDIFVTANQSDVTISVSNFPKSPNASQILDANKKLNFVQISSVIGSVNVGSGELIGGVQDISLIDDNDYIGNQTAKTGWWSFGRVTDALRIANIDRPSPSVDIALAAYVANRGDMRYHIASPINVTADGAKDYRLGENIYNHNAIDDWRGSIWGGQVDITDPDDVERTLEIPAIVDFLGRRAITDSDPQFGPWWTAAGPQRGVISAPNNGVGNINFLSPENQDAADAAHIDGVNFVGDDETYGTIVWGNRSLIRNRSSLLNKENVADLAMFIQRALPPLVRIELFNPNDPQTWKSIYRRVKPFIENVLVAGRAILPGEGRNWFWIGDQDVDRFEDASFNDLNDLNNGKYRVRFVCVPISATEFIGIDVVVTDSNSIASVVETPNV